MEEEVESETASEVVLANNILSSSTSLPPHLSPTMPPAIGDNFHDSPPTVQPRSGEIDYDLLYSEEVDETGGGNSASGGGGGHHEKLFRGKNKRTVAAVSAADRSAALTAMEELRGRGATTEDLVCRLCLPPRPFTAYSTLLTHYRQLHSHAV